MSAIVRIYRRSPCYELTTSRSQVSNRTIAYTTYVANSVSTSKVIQPPKSRGSDKLTMTPVRNRFPSIHRHHNHLATRTLLCVWSSQRLNSWVSHPSVGAKCPPISSQVLASQGQVPQVSDKCPSVGVKHRMVSDQVFQSWGRDKLGGASTSKSKSQWQVGRSYCLPVEGMLGRVGAPEAEANWAESVFPPVYSPKASWKS